MNLNPIVSEFEGISDQARIIAVAHDELIAIVDVSIFKWNLVIQISSLHRS